MVSTDHVRQELRAQLARAATSGRIDVLINCGELCRSITNGGSACASSCDAMQAELMGGDTLLLDRTNGSGMTVRYLLPRAVDGSIRVTDAGSPTNSDCEATTVGGRCGRQACRVEQLAKAVTTCAGRDPCRLHTALTSALKQQPPPSGLKGST